MSGLGKEETRTLIFLECLWVLLALAELPHFTLLFLASSLAVGLAVDLAVDRAVLIGVEIVIGLLRVFLSKVLISLQRYWMVKASS